MGGLNVAIVGAGIGGLTAAIALDRRGVNVAVYEKAHELKELGAGVVIGANGALVYDSLGLGDSLVAIAGNVSTLRQGPLTFAPWTIKTWTGEPLPGWRPPYAAAETYPLHRAEFQNMLLAALPPGMVHLGRECVAAVEDGEGVRIEFADGSQARADVLIGADGIHSVIQTVVGAKSDPVSEGIMAYRGLIPAARLDRIYDMSLMSMWVGPGQSFLTFPVSAGKMLNVVGFVPTDLDVEESWSAPGDVAALSAAYDGWNKQVRQITEAMEHTFRWGIYDRAPLKTWSTDRITVLGDAAHAVTPHLGQGANQAAEDAITLAVLLQDAQPADVSLRLRRYQDLRIERTRQVHDGSREAGALYRSTELSPGQQAEQIMAINDRLQLDTHDAERIANDALSAL